MTSRIVRLLHVEDDVIQQRVLAQNVKKLSGFTFDITVVVGEDEALHAFAPDKFDLVILDYQLEQGDGLDLLRQIRTQDPIIPVLAISGVATKEIAVDLVRAGADDFIEKQDLKGDRLTKSVLTAMKRAETVRQRAGDQVRPLPIQLEESAFELCRGYANQTGVESLSSLDAFEAALRQTPVTPRQLETLFAKISSKLAADGTFGAAPADRLLRPLVLEIFVRLFGDIHHIVPVQNASSRLG